MPADGDRRRLDRPRRADHGRVRRLRGGAGTRAGTPEEGACDRPDRPPGRSAGPARRRAARRLQPGLEVLTIAADLADPATPGRLVAETLARFGGLDVLINNAGLGLPTLFADAEPEHLARQLAVNFTAPLMLTRLCLPSLIERRGMIINIGSAITCVPNSALGAYGATKAGLAYWNDALRRELYSKGVTRLPGRAGPDQDRVHGRPQLAGAGRQEGASDPRQRRPVDDGRCR